MHSPMTRLLTRYPRTSDQGETRKSQQFLVHSILKHISMARACSNVGNCLKIFSPI